MKLYIKDIVCFDQESRNIRFRLEIRARFVHKFVFDHNFNSGELRMQKRL